jgi:hypothetical protein
LDSMASWSFNEHFAFKLRVEEAIMKNFIIR